jgi:hypothetical protein
MRAFVKLRGMLGTHRELARKLAELEKRIEGQDEEITAIFEAIRQLMAPPQKSSKRIGFHGGGAWRSAAGWDQIAGDSGS